MLSADAHKNKATEGGKQQEEEHRMRKCAVGSSVFRSHQDITPVWNEFQTFSARPLSHLQLFPFKGHVRASAGIYIPENQSWKICFVQTSDQQVL